MRRRPWAPIGFRGRKLSPSIQVGCQVRIHENLPGFGEALDRYAEVIDQNPGHEKFKVRVIDGPAKGQEHWLRVEDLKLVKGR